VDKSQLVILEAFVSETEGQRKENLQKAVDQYIFLQLKNGSLPTETKTQNLAKERR